ncbi:MAG TPA: hypothetical protein PLG10_03190 [Candidatus Dojkabacteria bacterium]|jgi:hypothetical protein|nr:hypothetical protein [Candidatus Dojkabacteria bacterium]
MKKIQKKNILIIILLVLFIISLSLGIYFLTNKEDSPITYSDDCVLQPMCHITDAVKCGPPKKLDPMNYLCTAQYFPEDICMGSIKCGIQNGRCRQVEKWRVKDCIRCAKKSGTNNEHCLNY